MHAVRTLLVAERENPDRLVVGSGNPLRWLEGDGQVRGRALPTWFGRLSMAMRRADDGGRVRVLVDLEAEGGFTIPAGALKVEAPFGAKVGWASVDGVAVPLDGDSVSVSRLPAAVVFEYNPPLENRR